MEVTQETSREVRVRVAKQKRLEVILPKWMKPSQVKARKELVTELASVLRKVDKGDIAVRLLRELAFAEDSEQVSKIEKSIRRFVREPSHKPAVESGLVTFGEFALRWATGELHKEHPFEVKFREPVTIKNDVSRTKALNKLIGKIPLVKLTYKDAKNALKALPKTMASRSTHRHCAQIIQTVVRYAMTVESIIPVDKYPLPVVGFLPPVGSPPSFPVIYPNDYAKLMRCDAVPLWRRFLYGFALLEGLRVGDLWRLRYRNVNFEDGTLTIPPGKNNEEARTWDLNVGVCEALKHFRAEASLDSFIFPRLTASEFLELAGWLRDDLVKAGVTREVRPDLFGDIEGQQPLRFQDLRASFVTIHLAMGWTYQDVMIQTRHTSAKVLEKHYARRVALMKGILKKQGPLLPLDVALGWAKGGGEGGGEKRAQS